MRLKLHLQYTGTGLFGWQTQLGLPTIQGHLIQAFQGLKIKADEPVAAGRTDAGVHALGQTVHVDVYKRLELVKFWGGLNRFLPPAIRVTRVAEVTEKFHARHGAKSRAYRYLIFNGRNLPPHLVGLATPVCVPLNLKKMQTALTKLKLGEHDFSAYRDAECQSRTPRCFLVRRKLGRVKDALGTPLLAFDIEADHFLHHMVRNLVGTLIQIGEGKRAVTALADILKTKQRTQAGPTALPEGLYFMAVKYPKHKELDAVG